MPRHGSVRLRLVAASAVLAAGLTPLLPSTALADTPQETVVPATVRDSYISASLYSRSTYSGHDGAGAQGVFHTLEDKGLVWTRYADGESVPVTRPAGITGTYAAGGDVLAYEYGGGEIGLWDAATGTTRTLRAPDGLDPVTAYRDLAVAYRAVQDENGKAWREMHLLVPEADGTTRDVPVTGVPEGVNLGRPAGGDENGLLFLADKGGQFLTVMVDRRTGEVRSWTTPGPKVYLDAQVTSGHVVLFNAGEPTVQVYSRSDLSAAPAQLTLTGRGLNPVQDLAVVGDWLVYRPSAGVTVQGQSLAGGPPVTLLATAYSGISAASDGSAVAVGRTSVALDDWGIRRIQPGPDGSPVVTQVKVLPKPPTVIKGLSLDQGRLAAAYETTTTGRSIRARSVAPTGTPFFGAETGSGGAESCPSDDAACSPVRSMGDGTTVRLSHVTEQLDRITVKSWHVDVPAGGRITDVSGRYLLFTSAGGQYVYKPGDIYFQPVTRAPGAAALSGSTLWTPGAAPGSVVPFDLATGRGGTPVTTDAGCAPTALQAVGRWLYWACDGRAGVYDRTAGASVAVPTGEAGLGDGFVVTHDRQNGKLVLTTVTGAVPASRVIGDLPDTGISQRDVRWTVDESGSNAAYVDDLQRVHLVPSGVAQQPLRLLDPARKAAETSPGHHTLTTALLSKPAAGWVLKVRSKATGKTVGGTDGGAVRGELNVDWDPGSALPNGRYDWTLSVTPADGVGAPLELSGEVRLLRGTAVRHDYAGPQAFPDGTGDLLALTSSGTITFRQGDGKGAFPSALSAGGWPAGILPVPAGDMTGDRCNDVLVRLSNGGLRLYRPVCGTALKPTTPYTTLGTTGWTQFDVLTSPGDLTKDGRPDLIARNPKTGAVYLYKGTGAGKLAAPVKLYDNWKSYKKIIGVGDLNGDGIGDLLAQDTSDNLYRYIGKGDGTFTARVKLFTKWGASYNAVVGAGDITGDGKADLVARDTAGGLYRLPGTGTGTFGARVKIGAGWQNYKGIF
ncbi:VCBS repeat-containing protein [Streptomyces sp. MBT49]|uniref:FG-GAP repeat domain-containing protein n=1 Tax=Streptomyces sp. MBT49 TaxID=1488380 RepID=UPI00190996B4|nr:VCBS repeat-containing protein [Streptomyces sp. MBT49]MBK3629830.1 VCBS repeat-containing protein [Streptomyces sp. MBT49]